MRPHTQTNVRRVPQMSTAKPHSGWPTPACAASPAEGPPLLFCDGFDSSPEDGFAHGLWQWQRNQCVIVSFLRLFFVRAIVKNALLLMPATVRAADGCRSFFSMPQPWNTTYITEWPGCALPCTTGSHSDGRPIKYGAAQHGDGEELPFRAVFIPKTIGLPRQARDKHREKLRQ
jgi:hypothetical protein